jgi:hypothetical protein
MLPHPPSWRFILILSSHLPFPLLALYQRISSSPRLYEMLHNTGGVYNEEQLAPCPTLKLEKHCCRLSGAAYSKYLQLPSVYVGHSSILSMHHAILPGTHLSQTTYLCLLYCVQTTMCSASFDLYYEWSLNVNTYYTRQFSLSTPWKYVRIKQV